MWISPLLVKTKKPIKHTKLVNPREPVESRKPVKSRKLVKYRKPDLPIIPYYQLSFKPVGKVYRGDY